MPRSSRHKSHKQSKHSSKDYSDSEEDVKLKEKRSKDENPVRVHRDSASGEKRKIPSQAREGKECKGPSGLGNGEVSEEYVSSKRRKERTEESVVGDRWNGGSEERGDVVRSVDKEISKWDIPKLESKLRDSSSKGEDLRAESKSKTRRYESGSASEVKEDGLASVVVDIEESKSKGDSKRKSERDFTRKEGRESNDKDHSLEKEKSWVQKHKPGDEDVNVVEIDVGKKQASQSVEEKQVKRFRENFEWSAQDEFKNCELEKDAEKKIRRRREGSSEKDKYYDDYRDGDERRVSSRSERSKDMKYKDSKHKGGRYTNKFHGDSHRDEKQRDGKYQEEADKDYKHRDDKYREDCEKDFRRRDDRHREDGDKDKCKDDKHREDGERDSKRRDDKHREVAEREGRLKDDRHHEKHRDDNDKYVRRRDEKYQEDGERHDRPKDNIYRENGGKDSRHKEEKYQEAEKDIRLKDSKQVDDFDREKRQRDSKYRDERMTRDHSGKKSDSKHPVDEGHATDHFSRKSSTYDDSPTYDDRSTSYRDEQSRRRLNEKEDYSDVRSRGTKDQRSDTERRSASSARMVPVPDKGRYSSINADIEHTSGHGRRVPEPDDSKYRDYGNEERVRHNVPLNKDYAGAFGGSENASSLSSDKIGQKDDGRSGELAAARCLKSDVRASPFHLVDKSQLSITDKRQISRSIDVEESMQRSGGSRDMKEYSRKEGRGNWELAIDALPGDDFSQVEADTMSVSSPCPKNNHFSNSTRTLLPPPPFRSGVDSPSLLGPGEDDGKGKVSSRSRRNGDQHMGRMPGNAWRGVPNWPSPANGFLPFPHASPPISFHSVVQPFPAPPMFGVRPPMDITATYHMPDADRFTGPGRPLGWHNQMDPWDGNTVFVDGTHIYGRPDWNHSRNMPGGRVWEPSGDLWKGPSSRSVSSESQSSEKENNPIQNMDDDVPLNQPPQIEQTRVDQQAESTEIIQSSKSYEKNVVEAPFMRLQENNDVTKMITKDDVRLCDVYLSKLDISADLSEPEIFNQCTVMVGMDQSIFPDVDDTRILYMEEAAETVEAERATRKIPSYTLNSIFEKAMSLYRTQKANARAEDENNLGPPAIGIIPIIDKEDRKVEDDMSNNPCKTTGMPVVEGDPVEVVADIQNGLRVEAHKEILEEKTDVSVVASTTEKLAPVSALGHVDMETSPLHNPALSDPQPCSEDKSLYVESLEKSDASLLSMAEDLSVESGGAVEELKLLDTTTKCGPLINSAMSTEVEAMMPRSVLSGSVNLSRIHHSPESTH